MPTSPHDKIEATCVPVDFRITPSGARIKWADLAGQPLVDPFFKDTVSRARCKQPAFNEAETDVSALFERSRLLPSIAPNGFIFHIGRCGSTLVANALRLADHTVVLAEPTPICQILEAEALQCPDLPWNDQDELRRILVDSLARILAFTSNRLVRALVIKGGGLDVLAWAKIRRSWPLMKSVLLIREPTEVMVSLLKDPTAWVLSRHHNMWETLLPGLACRGEFQSLTLVEFCARVLGLLLDRAMQMLGPDTWVVDYEDICDESIRAIARHMGIDIAEDATVPLQQAMASYSKDPFGKRQFVRDSARKRSEASEAVRMAVKQWAYKPYTELYSQRHAFGSVSEAVKTLRSGYPDSIGRK